MDNKIDFTIDLNEGEINVKNMREEGYYWVMLGDRWIIARWWSPFTDGSNPEWDVSGKIATDSSFDEIDERRIIRNES